MMFTEPFIKIAKLMDTKSGFLESNEHLLTLGTHNSLGTSQNMFTYMPVVNTKNHHNDF